ncbi:crotonobetainyl-CoA:carnitine CoA-transferase CaiB-like acyl-CoA transferase [Roseibium hamelinense]|uniref:Crotonobetainyl-CoA:carnitine CoA-transferase CaiB-like acyl-CoA transferase n=1 Tax=Roseibium hamelinense TaxID=150831 RepID=A0A562THG3_9HYPH|nr:CoA transferase [Roseibium hamelinense]MTI45805.1 CoA transferase [Roseibium hamelinense]TWI93012.1 crotonobetainyl-CoA:carnitine CoA-transferase CaiB-like acyl-CoA transferase [Roseibium hamelinense]
MTQPLGGLKVLDFTTLLPGPLATRLLADAGAHVTKIERPGGEDMRRFPPFKGGEPVLYTMLNHGKTVIELDLKDPGAAEQIAPLLDTADILVEQFRPGVMDRLGFGYETLSKKYPALIYCSISGYGQSGPRSQEAGHDLNYQALTGLLAQSYGSAAHASMPPAQIADIGGGSFPAVMNILLAVVERQKTGRGCHLDIAMADAMFTFGLFPYAQHLAGGPIDEAGTGLLTGGSPRYRIYFAADNAPVAVAALEQKFWDRFCDLIELPSSLRNDLKTPDETAARIAGTLSARPSAEWRAVFQAGDCCVTVVEPLSEALSDPHFAGRGLFPATDHPAVASPIARRFRTP